jgi:hypothetical protein
MLQSCEENRLTTLIVCQELFYECQVFVDLALEPDL